MAFIELTSFFLKIATHSLCGIACKQKNHRHQMRAYHYDMSYNFGRVQSRDDSVVQAL
jgi:hypothetical protein